VNSKKPAVIELRKLDQGTDLWFLSEMRARANKPPSADSVEMVKAWLKENESLISMKNCQFPGREDHAKSVDADINEFDEIIDEYFQEKDWAQDELLCSDTRNEMIFPDDFDEC
jgi:hypothetical protein